MKKWAKNFALSPLKTTGDSVYKMYSKFKIFKKIKIIILHYNLYFLSTLQTENHSYSTKNDSSILIFQFIGEAKIINVRVIQMLTLCSSFFFFFLLLNLTPRSLFTIFFYILNLLAKWFYVLFLLYLSFYIIRHINIDIIHNS